MKNIFHINNMVNDQGNILQSNSKLKKFFELISCNKKYNIVENNNESLALKVIESPLESQTIVMEKDYFQYSEDYFNQSNQLINEYLLYKTYSDQNETFLIKKVDKDSIAINIYSIIGMIIEKQRIKRKEILEKCGKILPLVIKMIRKTFAKSNISLINKKRLIVLQHISQNSLFKIIDAIIVEIINLAIKISHMNFMKKPLGILRKTVSVAATSIVKSGNVIN